MNMRNISEINNGKATGKGRYAGTGLVTSKSKCFGGRYHVAVRRALQVEYTPCTLEPELAEKGYIGKLLK